MPRWFAMTLVRLVLPALMALAPVNAFAHGSGGGGHGGGGGGGGGGHWGGGGGHWGGGGGHWGGGGVGRGGHLGWGGRYRGGYGFGVPFVFGPGFYPDYFGPYYQQPYYGPECVRLRRHVQTAAGWRWRYVTVCS